SAMGLLGRLLGQKGAGAQLSAFCGLAVATAGVVIVLGYLLQSPLFVLSDAIIPVAPSTGLAFAATGVGTMAVAGAGTWPMNAFVGAGIHQRLSRAFFPITAGIMLVVTLGMA